MDVLLKDFKIMLGLFRRGQGMVTGGL